MKYALVVFCRLSSSRLPAKALLWANGVTVLEFLLERLADTSECDSLIVATSCEPEDQTTAEIARASGFQVVQGSSVNLIERAMQAAASVEASHVVRVTADCPFLLSEIIDYGVGWYKKNDESKLATTIGSFPTGLDLEIIPVQMLERISNNPDLSADDKEHLSLYFKRKHSEQIELIPGRPEWQGAQKYTLDYFEDYALFLKRLKRGAAQMTVSELLAMDIGLSLDKRSDRQITI